MQGGEAGFVGLSSEHCWDVMLDPSIGIMCRGVIKPQWQDILVNLGMSKTLPATIRKYHKVHMSPNGNVVSGRMRYNWAVLKNPIKVLDSSWSFRIA